LTKPRTPPDRRHVQRHGRALQQPHCRCPEKPLL
jgi:hypothetical protein